MGRYLKAQGTCGVGAWREKKHCELDDIYAKTKQNTHTLGVKVKYKVSFLQECCLFSSTCMYLGLPVHAFSEGLANEVPLVDDFVGRAQGAKRLLRHGGDVVRRACL